MTRIQLGVSKGVIKEDGVFTHAHVRVSVSVCV